MKFAFATVVIAAVLATAAAHEGGNHGNNCANCSPTPTPAFSTADPGPINIPPQKLPTNPDDPNSVPPSAGEFGLRQETPDVPGNPCLTGRNNGEFVFATCALQAVDRRFVQANVGGQPALIVRRQYDPNFPGGPGAINAQLADGPNCLGIRPDGLLSAVPCSLENKAQLTNGEIRIGNQCITGGRTARLISGQVAIGTSGCTKFQTVLP